MTNFEKVMHEAPAYAKCTNLLTEDMMILDSQIWNLRLDISICSALVDANIVPSIVDIRRWISEYENDKIKVEDHLEIIEKYFILIEDFNQGIISDIKEVVSLLHKADYICYLLRRVAEIVES